LHSTGGAYGNDSRTHRRRPRGRYHAHPPSGATVLHVLLSIGVDVVNPIVKQILRSCPTAGLARDGSGDTPLRVAMRCPRAVPEILRLLVEGTDPEVLREGWDGKTALEHAFGKLSYDALGAPSGEAITEVRAALISALLAEAPALALVPGEAGLPLHIAAKGSPLSVLRIVVEAAPAAACRSRSSGALLSTLSCDPRSDWKEAANDCDHCCTRRRSLPFLIRHRRARRACAGVPRIAPRLCCVRRAWERTIPHLHLAASNAKEAGALPVVELLLAAFPDHVRRIPVGSRTPARRAKQWRAPSVVLALIRAAQSACCGQTLTITRAGFPPLCAFC